VALLREMRGLTRAQPVVAGVAAALAGFLVQGLVDFTLWDMRCLPGKTETRDRDTVRAEKVRMTWPQRLGCELNEKGSYPDGTPREIAARRASGEEMPILP